MSMAAAAQPRIRVLPSELADQIAAGEVVERPASVVKELVENAIDAGARKVEIEVEAGGRRLIRVVDDGCGMTADEARLSLRRHATSKIVQADDLWGLVTFGFRGEALPSIAAVSRLSLATKTRDAVAGFRLQVEGGREAEAREVGMPAGTHIEVRDLFYNVPARLKFLKAEATEAGNISEAVLRLGLAHPEVHLKLRVNERSALDLPPQRELGERVRAALARRGAGALHEAAGEEGGVTVRAFLASPEEASTTPRSTFSFVGRRFVRDRSLLSALCLGYGELLDKGRYPLSALFVDVPGAEVDINVHPQKLEVRFARAQEVYAAVRHVVGAAIARAPWLSTARSHSLAPEPSAAAAEWPRAVSRPPSRARDGGAEPWSRGAVASRGGDAELWSPGGAGSWSPAPAVGASVSGSSAARDAETPAGDAARAPTDLGFFAALDYLGQLDKTYLVCRAPGELVLVDQHAAHERVAFHRLRTAHAQRSIARQRLLFPIPIELDDVAAASCATEAGRAELAGLGFEVDAFGPMTVLLRAVPEVAKNADPKPLLLDVIARLAEGEAARVTEDALDHVFATMACHSVVRAGDVLSHEQVAALFAQLDGVDVRSHCPHGRPVLVRLTTAELERRFGRT